MFVYSKGSIPDRYTCSSCGAHGVKLWRGRRVAYGGIICYSCISDKSYPYYHMAHIGDRLFAAIPSKDEKFFWGDSEVPGSAMAWWRKLPLVNGCTNESVDNERNAKECRELDSFAMISDYSKECSESAEGRVSRIERFALLSDMINSLTHNESLAIIMRFGLDGKGSRTFDEISKSCNRTTQGLVSVSRASQIFDKAIVKLKRAYNNEVGQGEFKRLTVQLFHNYANPCILSKHV